MGFRLNRYSVGDDRLDNRCLSISLEASQDPILETDAGAVRAFSAGGNLGHMGFWRDPKRRLEWMVFLVAIAAFYSRWGYRQPMLGRLSILFRQEKQAIILHIRLHTKGARLLF